MISLISSDAVFASPTHNFLRLIGLRHIAS